jgi:tetratricopeptide (TPR) repeat protein
VGRLSVVVLALLCVWVVPLPGRASDFWQEVRSPGTRAFRLEVTRGRAALEARRWQEARAAGERAMALRPVRCEGPALMGRALTEMDDVEGAVARFREALEREGTCLRAGEEAARAAEVAAVAGDPALAAEILQGLVATMSEGARRRALYALYGDVLLTLGPDHLEPATRAFREVLRHQSDARSALGLALALRRAGRPDEAAELARVAAAHGRVDAMVARVPVPTAERAARRAVALEALGDVEGARAAWRTAAEGTVWRRHSEEELHRLRVANGGRR